MPLESNFLVIFKQKRTFHDFPFIFKRKPQIKFSNANETEASEAINHFLCVANRRIRCSTILLLYQRPTINCWLQNESKFSAALMQWVMQRTHQTNSNSNNFSLFSNYRRTTLQVSPARVRARIHPAVQSAAAPTQPRRTGGACQKSAVPLQHLRQGICHRVQPADAHIQGESIG